MQPLIHPTAVVDPGASVGEDEVPVGPSAVFTDDRVPWTTSEHWQIMPTLVRVGASIGANATLVAGVETGRWARVATDAVVTHTVGSHELAAGNSAWQLDWVGHCGATRRQVREQAAGACPQSGMVLDAEPANWGVDAARTG